jgi:hypothetical protein
MMLYNQYLVSEQEALSLEDLICFEATVLVGGKKVLVETRSGKFVCASFGVSFGTWTMLVNGGFHIL